MEVMRKQVRIKISASVSELQSVNEARFSFINEP